MSDKNFKDYTTDEKLDVVLEALANITLFLVSKYPDYLEQICTIRKKHNKELMEEIIQTAPDEIIEKLKGEE